MTINNQDEREALIAAINSNLEWDWPGEPNVPSSQDCLGDLADAILAANFHRNVGAVSVEAHHAVTLEIADGGYHGRFVCNAPHESLCHAVWSCGCEQWYEECIRNGVPAHKPDSEDAERWHAGKFGDECNLQPWFDESDESLSGTVTVPVVASFEGDYYEFTLTPTSPPPSEVRVTAERVDSRDAACVENWPEARSGEYDSRCCRFPKSCSAGIPVAGEVDRG